METSNNEWNDGAVPPSGESGVEPVYDGEDTRNLEPPSDSDTKSDTVRRIVAGQSYFYNKRLSDRVRAAKLQMARQGIMPVGNGLGIYGYRNAAEQGRRVIDPEEAPVVRRIFDEFDRGLSNSKIARGLEADGIPTKRGGKWSAAMIRNILRNTSYVGIAYYGKTRTVWHPESGPVKVGMPRTEWVEIRGLTPPLVDLEVFERVQRKMDLKMVGRRHVVSRG